MYNIVNIDVLQLPIKSITLILYGIFLFHYKYVLYIVYNISTTYKADSNNDEVKCTLHFNFISLITSEGGDITLFHTNIAMLSISIG